MYGEPKAPVFQRIQYLRVHYIVGNLSSRRKQLQLDTICHFLSAALLSEIRATSVFNNLAISVDSVWAFLPSFVQPGKTLTTLPRLSMRIFVGIAFVSKVFHNAPSGSATQRNLTPFF